MGLEINEDNDFDYIQDYLKEQLNSDLTSSIESSKMKGENYKIIEEHFTLYNKAIKNLTFTCNHLISENEILKKCSFF